MKLKMHSYRTNVFIPLILLLFALCHACANIHQIDGRNKSKIQFGIVQDCWNTKFDIIQETKDIPYGKNFGYIYTPANENEYEIYDVLYMPSLPKKLSGSFATNKIENATAGVKTEKILTSGQHRMIYWFDEGDPEGSYHIEIYVNDQIDQVIKFEVVK